jgi:cell division protein FtsB
MRLEPTRQKVLVRALLVVMLLGALFVIGFNLFHPGRGQRLERLSASANRLEAMMVRAERDNEGLTAELQRLERGPEGWQALAREEYGMLLPGEYVFRFPTVAKPEANEVPASE